MDQERERIQADLRGLLHGEVRCDDVLVQMYASDASIYEIKPLGVVRPRGLADVVACVQYAAENGIPIHARGAVGLATSPGTAPSRSPIASISAHALSKSRTGTGLPWKFSRCIRSTPHPLMVRATIAVGLLPRQTFVKAADNASGSCPSTSITFHPNAFILVAIALALCCADTGAACPCPLQLKMTQTLLSL